jgi:hypothetical protein
VITLSGLLNCTGNYLIQKQLSIFSSVFSLFTFLNFFFSFQFENFNRQLLGCD